MAPSKAARARLDDRVLITMTNRKGGGEGRGEDGARSRRPGRPTEAGTALPDTKLNPFERAV